ncbi:uncharacterized protein CTHT_0041590 [Thermochaetoides thermophila DSM 1495]|uniref:Uncharacterized protein n=1 Tax=Chaetomium thermophilum (strain DSM 1495 / CBS 144.50 / IMI 039719) TaxID=759272 RepID=G0SAA6_CHATD|nr:hypothetical protein CTHT_0041590 [Thermochaetoides thermophila DSM 1495]EGS19678.1 hypothetical protein CTHT_0041590 [Thermochaetoides thermophila DSM 1495]
MGVYICAETCESHYGKKPNCNITLADNETAIFIGDVEFGSFQGDPDIGGVGVLAAFLAVTSLAICFSVASTGWWLYKNLGLAGPQPHLEERTNNIAGLFEALIVNCSDQQIFTGLAYALCLRYSKSCTVTAYHYNIVTNLLQMRSWLRDSGWMDLGDRGLSPEDDPSTFGQLIPLLLIFLTLFTFLQIMSERGALFRKARHAGSKEHQRLQANADNTPENVTSRPNEKVSFVEAGNIANSLNDPEAIPVLRDGPRRYGKSRASINRCGVNESNNEKKTNNSGDAIAQDFPAGEESDTGLVTPSIAESSQFMPSATTGPKQTKTYSTYSPDTILSSQQSSTTEVSPGPFMSPAIASPFSLPFNSPTTASTKSQVKHAHTHSKVIDLKYNSASQSQTQMYFSPDDSPLSKQAATLAVGSLPGTPSNGSGGNGSGPSGRGTPVGKGQSQGVGSPAMEVAGEFQF